MAAVSGARETAKATAAAALAAEDAGIKAWAAVEAAETALAVQSAFAHVSYPKATAAARGKAAMVSRSTGLAAAGALSLREHAAVAVGGAREAEASMRDCLNALRAATEAAEQAAAAATEAARQAEAKWLPYAATEAAEQTGPYGQ